MNKKINELDCNIVFSFIGGTLVPLEDSSTAFFKHSWIVFFTFFIETKSQTKTGLYLVEMISMCEMNVYMCV